MIDVKNAIDRRRKTMDSWIKAGRFDLDVYIEFFEVSAKVAARDAKVLGYCKMSTYESLSEFLSNHKMDSPITAIEFAKLKDDRETFLKKKGYSDEALEAFGLWHAPSEDLPFKGSNEIQIMLAKGYPHKVIKEAVDFSTELFNPKPTFRLSEMAKLTMKRPPYSSRPYEEATDSYTSEEECVLKNIDKKSLAGKTLAEAGELIQAAIDEVTNNKNEDRPPVRLSSTYEFSQIVRGEESAAVQAALAHPKEMEELLRVVMAPSTGGRPSKRDFGELPFEIPSYDYFNKKPFTERDLTDLIGLTQSSSKSPGEIERLCATYAKYGTIVAEESISKSARNNHRYYDAPIAKECFELYAKEGMPCDEIAQKIFGDEKQRNKVGALINHYKITHPDEIDKTALHIPRNFDEARRTVRNSAFEAAEEMFKQGKSLSEIAKLLKNQVPKNLVKSCPSINAIETHLIEKGLINPYENGEIEDTQIVEASFAATNPGQLTEYAPGATTKYRKGSTATLLDDYGVPSWTEDSKTRANVRREILKSQNRAQAFLRANPIAMEILNRTGDFEAAVAATRNQEPPLKIVCGKNRRSMIEKAKETKEATTKDAGDAMEM